MLRPEILFDALALPYELVTRHPVWESDCARMAGELPPAARRVLDLGCGPGNSTTHLREAIGPGAIGADPSRAMLRRAHRRDGRLALLCADAGRLPVRSRSLDAVTFHSVLYLLPDRTAVLAEARRALRPGGRIALLEPHGGFAETAKGLARALLRPRWAFCAALWRALSSAYGRFTPDSVRAALEGAGLRVLKIEEALDGMGLVAVAERP